MVCVQVSRRCHARLGTSIRAGMGGPLAALRASPLATGRFGRAWLLLRLLRAAPPPQAPAGAGELAGQAQEEEGEGEEDKEKVEAHQHADVHRRLVGLEACGGLELGVHTATVKSRQAGHVGGQGR